MSADIFKSSSRQKNDYAGVLECDDESSYFYLYSIKNPEGSKIVGAVQLPYSPSVNPDDQDHYEIKWNAKEDTVGLFHKALLLAAFNLNAYLPSNGVYPALTSDELEQSRKSWVS